MIWAVDELEHWLATQARALGLDAAGVEDASPDVLREFCTRVLAELAARGVLAGAEEVGCYAAPRAGGN